MSNNEQGSPNLYKNRIDHKKFTAAAIYNMVDVVKQDPDAIRAKMYFYTTIGTVTGTWLPLDEDASESDKLQEKLHNSVTDHRNQQLIERERDSDELILTNDSGTIPLVNVTIRPYNGPEHHLSYFLLFADQIVGISYGEEKRQSD